VVARDAKLAVAHMGASRGERGANPVPSSRSTAKAKPWPNCSRSPGLRCRAPDTNAPAIAAIAGALSSRGSLPAGGMGSRRSHNCKHSIHHFPGGVAWQVTWKT
jgi:hypothetical protein